MSDDVADLLSTIQNGPSSSRNNTLGNLIPSKLVAYTSPQISFKEFKQEVLNSSQLQINSLNDDSENELNFSLKIKHLEEKAKELLTLPVTQSIESTEPRRNLLSKDTYSNKNNIFTKQAVNQSYMNENACFKHIK